MKFHNPFESESAIIVIFTMCIILFLGAMPLVALLLLYPLPTLGVILLAMAVRVAYYMRKGK
jgi:hypothetical protein